MSMEPRCYQGQQHDLRMARLLALADAAKADPSLISNHMGTVDRQLSERREGLAECIPIVEAMACFDEEDAEWVASAKGEITKLDAALAVYQKAVSA